MLDHAPRVRTTGQQPRTRAVRPVIPGEATPSGRRQQLRQRDDTPDAGPRLRGAPARGLESRLTPSLVVVGLLVGPMFVVGEAMFMLGWGRGLLAEIERRVGPTHLRDLAHP